MTTKLLVSVLFLGSLGAVADEASTCYSARLRATLPNAGTIILEATPVGKTVAEADALGLAYCQEKYPERTCTVAGHAIVDCR